MNKKQTEVFIVNDATSGQTLGVMSSLNKAYSRVVFYVTPNLSAALINGKLPLTMDNFISTWNAWKSIFIELNGTIILEISSYKIDE